MIKWEKVRQGMYKTKVEIKKDNFSFIIINSHLKNRKNKNIWYVEVYKNNDNIPTWIVKNIYNDFDRQKEIESLKEAKICTEKMIKDMGK